MQDILFPETMPKEARLRALVDSADEVEDTTYQKPLSEEALTVKRQQFSDRSIELAVLEDELDEVKSTYKIKMDPVKQVSKALLAQIKTKQETVKGRLYHMKNHQSGFVETYDNEGDLISTRRLRPDEKQKSIFSIAQ